MTFNLTNAPTYYLAGRLQTLAAMIASLTACGNTDAANVAIEERNAIERELISRETPFVANDDDAIDPNYDPQV